MDLHVCLCGCIVLCMRICMSYLHVLYCVCMFVYICLFCIVSLSFMYYVKVTCGPLLLEHEDKTNKNSTSPLLLFVCFVCFPRKFFNVCLVLFVFVVNLAAILRLAFWGRSPPSVVSTDVLSFFSCSLTQMQVHMKYNSARTAQKTQMDTAYISRYV